MSTSADWTEMATRLRHHVNTLAHKPRLPSSPEHHQAGEYIHAQLREAGFTVEESRFTESGFAGTNLLTQPLPVKSDHPLLIVGAHYDSVPGSPGADDNASAVAALLELAHWIGPRLAAGEPLAHRLQLAAYDLEEYGFIGSYIHSRDVERSGTAVRAMISLEMLGYADDRPGSQKLPQHLASLYPDVGNFIGVCGNEASHELVQRVTAGMKAIEGLPVESIAVPGKGETLTAIRLSDHSSFWERGYSALMITDTAFMRNPHYHQPSDRPETLNYDFLARVTAGVCEAVWRLLRE
jgi:Zn-dependent M28 family amino/carboxypeptidase